jgi:hypothetical protein
MDGQTNGSAFLSIHLCLHLLQRTREEAARICLTSGSELTQHAIYNDIWNKTNEEKEVEAKQVANF